MTFIKGQPAWNKNTKWNEEVRAKISVGRKGKQAWNKGRPMTNQHRQNIIEGLKRSKKVLI